MLSDKEDSDQKNTSQEIIDNIFNANDKTTIHVEPLPGSFKNGITKSNEDESNVDVDMWTRHNRDYPLRSAYEKKIEHTKQQDEQVVTDFQWVCSFTYFSNTL